MRTCKQVANYYAQNIENVEYENFIEDINLNISEALTYDDVLLVPQYSNIESRYQISVESELDEDHIFELPIIASPMDTISEEDMAAAMGIMGGLCVIHRYNSIEMQCGIVKQAVKAGAPVDLLAAAIGITGDYVERAEALNANGVEIICLDVAHGHHILMKQALKALREIFKNNLHLMAGNIATLEGFNDISDWGADSIRCNIGGGSICSTRVQTGHGVPGLQTIFDCARSDRTSKIIADGGIKNSGDIVKALAAGADFVMVGSLFSGTDQCPGETVSTSKGKFKAYRGMASKDAQLDWRGRTSSLEGVATMVPHKGSVMDIIKELERGIRSGLSYSGARTIPELQAKAKFIRQTGAGQHESSAHILG